VSYELSNSTRGYNYYFRLWTADEIGNYSNISNGATVYVPFTGYVSGKVTKQDNIQISGIEIKVLQEDGTLKDQTKTNVTGDYTITVVTGTYNVRASSIGYRTEITTGVVVTKDTITNINFVAYKDIILTLTGSDKEIVLSWTLYESAGIVNYRIYRSTVNIESYYQIVDTVTVKEARDKGLINDVTYYYRIEGMDSYETAIGKSDIKSVYPRRMVIVGEDTITGIVTKKDGKTPITGISVRAIKNGVAIKEEWTYTDGSYSISGLAAGTYIVEARWTLNNITSVVGKEIPTGKGDADFSLEIEVQLGVITGKVALANNTVKEANKRFFAMAQNDKSTGDVRLLTTRNDSVKKMLVAGNNIAFVELTLTPTLSHQERGGIIKVPVNDDGTFEIPNLLPGRYTVKAYNGMVYSNPQTVDLKEGEKLNVTFNYEGLPVEGVYAYPNPTKIGEITIRFYSGWVNPEREIRIYNIAGELVKQVNSEEIADNNAGIYKYNWNCTNDSGNNVASGVYVYIVNVKNRETLETKSVTKKFAIIR